MKKHSPGDTKDAYQPTAFATGVAVILSAGIFLSAYWLPRSFFANTVLCGTKEGAKEALVMLKEWTTWMASIQTATIAALGVLAKDGVLSFRLARNQLRLVVLVILFNTVALFFSGWLLTSTSSLMLRVYANGVGNFDFYNYPLYAYMTDLDSTRPFTVAFFAFWNHWLWGIGVLLFGALSLSLTARR